MDYLFSDSAARTILFEPVLKGANVTFYKIDDEQYYMDFSPNNKRQRNG